MALQPALPHIGKLVRKNLEELGMTKSEFARRIDTSPQNIYGIFRRKSCDVALLHRISLVLNTDLVQYYCTEAMTVSDKNGDTTSKSVGQLRKELQTAINERDSYKQEVSYLKEILQLMKSKDGKSDNKPKK